MKTGYTYILTNKCRTMLYHSGPNDIVRRVKQHKSHYQKAYSQIDTIVSIALLSASREQINRIFPISRAQNINPPVPTYTPPAM